MSEGPKYLVQSDCGLEVFDTLKEARDAFDSAVQAEQDAASEGWAEEAEYLPRLSVYYLLAEHSLDSRTLEQVEADGDEQVADRMRANGWDFFAEGKVTEYPDPIATLTAELDALRAEVAALKANSAAGDVLPPIDEDLRLYRERMIRTCSLCGRPIAPMAPRWVGLWSESEDVDTHIGRYHRICRVITDVKCWESWHKDILNDLDDADVEDVRREIPDELREEWVELCLAHHWIP